MRTRTDSLSAVLACRRSKQVREFTEFLFRTRYGRADVLKRCLISKLGAKACSKQLYTSLEVVSMVDVNDWAGRSHTSLSAVRRPPVYNINVVPESGGGTAGRGAVALVYG